MTTTTAPTLTLTGMADTAEDRPVLLAVSYLRVSTREQAERALKAVLRDEPEWRGMIEIVTVPERRRCPPTCRTSRRSRHHNV